MPKVIRILVLLAVFAIPVLLGWTWLDHFRETKLPQPTGPCAVGRVTYDWEDPRAHRASRLDLVSRSPNPTIPGDQRLLTALLAVGG